MKTKNPPKRKYGDLAVNERLYVAGLLDEFDAAANRRDRSGMIAMLKRVDLAESYATYWVDTMIGDQTFYRFWTDGKSAVKVGC